MITELELASPLQRALYLRALSESTGFPLEAEEVLALAALAKPRRVKRGEVLISEGRRPSATYRVVEGRVGVRFRGHKVASAEPGDTVGLLALLARTKEMRAQALADTLVLEIDAESFVDVFEDHFGMLERALRSVAEELLELYREEPSLLFVREPDPGPEPPRPLDLVHRMLALRRSSIFNNTNLDTLAQFCRGLDEVEFEPSQTIWEEDTPSEGRTLLIVHGIVRCVTNRRVYRAGTDFAIGALDTIAMSPRWHDAIADSRVVGLWSEREFMIDLLEDNVEMGMDMLAQMASALFDARARWTSDKTEPWESMRTATTSGRQTIPP